MNVKFKWSLVWLFAALSFCTFALAGPDDDTKDPTTQPTLVNVSDKAAIDAAMDKEIEVEGVVKSAEWSGNGKVCVIKFEKTEASKLTAAIFQKNKDKLDKAFNGDIAKTLTGAHVRIKGRIQEFNDKPEIVIAIANQLTIMEPGK